MINETEALLGYLAEAVPAHVLGADPFEIEALIQRMWRREYARAGQVAMSALAVLEMACWDIVGKALDQPVYRLLGRPVRDRIKAYANGWYTVERTPDEFRNAARRAVDKGYRAVKSTRSAQERGELEPRERTRALELVEAVRDAVGPDVEILVEMHGRFSPAQAVAAAPGARAVPAFVDRGAGAAREPRRAAEGRRPGQDPLRDGRAHPRPRRVPQLLELQAADVIQPDLTMCGGILETRRIAAWAEACYVLVAPHNVGGPVSTAAALHLAAVTPNFKIQEHFNDFGEPYVKAAALGVTLDEDVIAEHPRRPIHSDLFAEDWHLRQAAPA